MKDKILDLIRDKPKHYATLIKNNETLNRWVMNTSLIVSENYKEMIYSAIHGESNICEYGNKKTISRISEGWIGCGPAAVCHCTRSAIAENVSKTKLSFSESEKIAINEKRESTLLDKYGFRYNSQRPEVKTKLSKNKLPDNIHQLLSDRDWLENEYVIKERTLSDIALELGVYYGTVGEYCRQHNFEIRQRTNYSIEENIICDYLSGIGVSYVRNDWTVLGNREIDIYIPDFRIGIEVNGLYWHSYNPFCAHTPSYENKLRHISKTRDAMNAGISLIQLTDYEIKNNLDMVKSLILSKLGKLKRIYARKCDIRLVKKDEERGFLEKNHFQGFSGSSHAVGLYSEDSLVMIMTFGKPRYAKNYDVEMIRLCTEAGTIVIGGAPKLLKHSIKEFKFANIISYCDNSKFSGSVYSSLGFTPLDFKSPGYLWTDGSTIIPRYKSQHKVLAKWLKTYDPSKSESENMFSARYRRYWDCGQQPWSLNIKSDS